jgi:AraC-like DNA-binding protein
MNRDKLKENRVHGQPMYPVSAYLVECAAGDPILECHWHDEFEFIVMTSGKAVFQVGATNYELTAGQAVFIHSGDIHAGYPLDQSACSFYAFVFHAGFLSSSTYDAVQEKFIEPLLTRQYVPPVHLKGELPWEDEILALLLNMIRAHTELSLTRELTTKAQLYIILSHLYLHAIEHSPHSAGTFATREKADRLKTVLHYIHEHYQEPLRLKELAIQANMSEGHFCRFFRELMKKSPIDYVNRYRTQQAARQLEQSHKKIADIALDTGFDNISYFINVFKQHHGQTPSHYRKRNQSS